MTEGDKVFNEILRMKYELVRMNVVPDKVELTRAQYDALKAHCMAGMTYTMDDRCSSIFGLKIIIKDDSV